MQARCQLPMSPLHAGYRGRLSESTQLEQGNETSISNAVQDSWLARARLKQYYLGNVIRRHRIYSSEVSNTARSVKRADRQNI